MREESGRSLLEIIGVLAIGVIMIVAAYGMYKTIDTRQKRLIAFEKIAEVAKKTKILYGYSGYQNASIENLVAKGAISDARPPVGKSWQIHSPKTGTSFAIVIKDVPNGDCKYLQMKQADWIKQIRGSCMNMFIQVE